MMKEEREGRREGGKEWGGKKEKEVRKKEKDNYSLIRQP